MKVLCLSGFSGVSGNMFVGALLDAGLPEKELRAMAGALPVSGYKLKIEKVLKRGIKATYFEVELDEAARQPHRRLADIVKLIGASGLSAAVKTRSAAVFNRLAAAEAKVHGTTPDEVHFHEVGGVDAILDIVGTVFGLEALGIEKVYADSLRTGRGFTSAAHGTMPVPAPATAELLNGVPYTLGDIEKELLTPTGAALLSVLCDGFGDVPEGFAAERTAYGAGGWELDIPNVLRVRVGSLPPAEKDSLTVFEANIDDASPQLFDYAMRRLFKAGALDVWLTPVQMKKNRPAVTLSALAPAGLRAEMEDIIFSETTTLGIRRYAVRRSAAERREETVRTLWGEARVKIGSVGGKVCSVTPEYEDCRRLAEAAGAPLKDVLEAARAAVKRGR